MKMEVPPETLDELDDSYLYLSTLLLGKSGDCPACDFTGHPERLRFLRSEETAVYCGDCGRRIPPEDIGDTPEPEDRAHIG